MKTRDKLLIGAAVGAGALWGARTWLRSRRRIALEGRVVLVSGASSGFGFLIARQAAEQGARLALAARDESDLRRAEADLRQAGARDVLVVPTDVADEAQARTFVERAAQHYGRIDVLVNNAGTMLVGPIEAMTVDDFRALLATNCWGAIYTSLAALPHMKRQRFGRIANVCSIGAKLAAPHMLPYTVSKFALAGFTEGLRAELARDNILVTGIYPGTIRTGGHNHAWFKGEQADEYAWFALGDTVPGLATSAEYAARRLWRAVCDGDPEVVIGWNAVVAVAFHNLFPDWLAETMALVNLGLPAASNLDAPPVQGAQLVDKMPSILDRLLTQGVRP